MSKLLSDDWINLQKKFLDIAEEKVKKMKEAFEVKDFKLIKLYAHQLKGSGASFGFQEITEISEQIEQKCIQDFCFEDEVIKMIHKLADTVEKFKSNYIH
ncbi:MAG: Hpt domain-containing protein [Candidatus Kryptonium sp.]